MARYAVVDRDTKKVINVIIWDGKSEVSGLTDNSSILLVQTESGDIGDIYDESANRFIKWYEIVRSKILDKVKENAELTPSEIYEFMKEVEGV